MRKKSVLHPLPDDFTIQQAALVEPFACAMHAVERGGITHEDVLVISGLRAIGTWHDKRGKKARAKADHRA